ncbi:MAG TPA: hypothetical protein VHM90_00570 [Phycisphaerae bacterium]|jgi:hypothetical protein|nr:hypothetical protein [Phycisphaerae bacterium]
MKKLLAVALLSLATLPACNTRKDFPEPYLGWHNPSYSQIFGRLVRLPGANPDDPPTWLVRFGMPGDAYRGELALTPATALTGYSGGEHVELKGHLLDQSTTDAYNGRWFVIDSIQMWSNYR